MYPHAAGFVRGNKSELCHFLVTPSNQYLGPRIEPRTGKWDTHNIDPTLKLVRGTLAAAKRRMHEALVGRYKVRGEAAECNPLKQIVKRVLEVNKLLSDYLVTNKEVLVENDVLIRGIVINTLKMKLAQCGEDGRKAVESKILESMEHYAKENRDDLEKLPFVTQNDDINDFTGYSLLKEVISVAGQEGFEHSTSASKSALTSQATVAIDTIIGCMRLTGEYIENFTTKTGLTDPDNDIHQKWESILLSIAPDSADEMQSVPEKQRRLAESQDGLVSHLLVEMFEVLSCHAFTFFNHVIGKSKKSVTPFVRKFTEDCILYCMAPLFWFDKDLMYSSNDGVNADLFSDKRHETHRDDSRKLAYAYTTFSSIFINSLNAYLSQAPDNISKLESVKGDLMKRIYAEIGLPWEGGDASALPVLGDLHVGEFLGKANAWYIDRGVKTARSAFTEILKTLTHVKLENSVYEGALSMQEFNPTAKYNKFIDTLQGKIPAFTSNEIKINQTVLFAVRLLYASKRLNPLFVGRYLIGEIPPSSKFDCAKEYFKNYNVFWVKGYVASNNKTDGAGKQEAPPSTQKKGSATPPSRQSSNREVSTAGGGGGGSDESWEERADRGLGAELPAATKEALKLVLTNHSPATPFNPDTASGYESLLQMFKLKPTAVYYVPKPPPPEPPKPQRNQQRPQQNQQQRPQQQQSHQGQRRQSQGQPSRPASAASTRPQTTPRAQKGKRHQNNGN